MASYTHFKDEVLPRIKRQGYNCVQLMAVQVCEGLTGVLRAVDLVRYCSFSDSQRELVLGACILRELWLPRHQSFCPRVQKWDP